MQLKRTRALLLGSVVMGIIFWLGFIMGEGNYKQKVSDAIVSGDTSLAIALCYHAQENKADVANSPLYWAAIAKSMAKRGDMEGVIFNLNKIAELLGK